MRLAHLSNQVFITDALQQKREQSQEHPFSQQTPAISDKRSAREVFDNLLDYVDFGEMANLFLRHCGVDEYPSPEEFANNIIRHHERFLAKNGLPKYLKLLSLFSASFVHIASTSGQTTSAEDGILDQLRASAFCIAFQFERSGTKDKEAEAGGDSGQVCVFVKPAREVPIVTENAERACRAEEGNGYLFD